MSRLFELFPSRIYPYPSHQEATASFAAEVEYTLGAGVFYLRLGRDTPPFSPISAQDMALLQDPFAKLVLVRGVLPLTPRALLTELDAQNSQPGGLPVQCSFLVADGGKIPWTPATARLDRRFRFVITRGLTPESQADLMISTSSNLDSKERFLQVIAWDEVNKVYQFYDRLGQGWGWAGNSWDAFASDTKGKGPFHSHVNGSMVMKELKQPWIHWHSQAASISTEALAPDDALRNESLFEQKNGAEALERDVVRPGICRWNEARFKKLFQGGTLKEAPQFFRQLLSTTTINLASASEECAQVRANHPIRLPISFFINEAAFLNLLGLQPDITRPEVDGGIYARCLTKYDVSISDGTFKSKGDTHFVFVVPEAAFEDHVVLQKLIELNLLSHKLAASLLMVDFTNPVFSTRRAALLAHVPNEIHLTNENSDLESRILDSISAMNPTPDDPASEFLANWSLTASVWAFEFERRIEAYMRCVNAAVLTEGGFDPLFCLAESRRREFRRRPLAEYRFTTPLTNIREDAPLLEMTPVATVRPKTNQLTSRNVPYVDADSL
jgi:hypothetical protein